jgi:outer membrane biosynthesis protein TonB
MTNEEFDEQALISALTAPGSPAELGDEQRYREMFRAAQASPVAVAPAAVGRTAVRRLGAGTSLAVVFALATGGVAAAYSSNLPDPVQRAVHSVLSPIGVPAVEPERHVVEAEKPPAPEPAPEPTPEPPVPAPTHPVVKPSEKPSSEPSPSESVDPTPSTDPSLSESPTPSESPTDVPSSSAPTDPTTSPSPSGSPSPTTPAVPEPTAVTISSAGAGGKVTSGGTAVVTGQVTAADGAPVPDVLVYLQERTSSGWLRVATGRTAADGSIALVSRPVQRTIEVRLKAAKLRSAPWQLTVQPTVTASAGTVDRVSTVSATVAGGQAGDQVYLQTTRNGQVVVEGQVTLGAGGGIRFEVTAPKLDRWYVVQLPATDAHAAAQVRVLVKAGAGDES